MKKNQCALTPPMGWNSWDCYGASVNEEQLLGNAIYMAEHLKEYGWEYVVCDIQWYEPEATSTMYHPFYPLTMDEYSRLIPAEKRFPSAANGIGFKAISDKIHNLGLKFGIHIMRGIPRQAVHNATPIKNSTKTARDIAHPYSICSWNTDMYGVNAEAEGAAEYYDSLFELYASWGVDYVKVDDICNTEYTPHNPYSARKEIELIRAAIDKCGREMVLSLSPGPAIIEHAEHLCKNANMWRMTGDFWDNWHQLYAMFEKCEKWSPYVSEGCWPDCDMLPLGRIEVNNHKDGGTGRNTNFTREEQITMMTLWTIFRSPMMLGTELRAMDSFTLDLLTNDEVIYVLKNTSGGRQVLRTNDTVVWTTKDKEGNQYVAIFNLSNSIITPSIPLRYFTEKENCIIRDLWKKEDVGVMNHFIQTSILPHGAVLFKLI